LNASHSAQDVVFVIDTSSSIGFTNFQLIREFVGNISAELINSSPGSAVGIILFDDNANIQFNLQTHTSLNTLLPAINQLPYGGGGTDTAEALRLLLSSAQNGTLGLRSGSSNVAIVIAGRRSNNQSATLSAAATLHASNIFDVFAVGIRGFNPIELISIATFREFYFFENSFDKSSLMLLKDEVLRQLCECKQLK